MRRLLCLIPVVLVACAATPPQEAPDGSPVAIGQSVRVGDVRITPTQLLEDSRCPRGVQCVQAGTVRIQALVEAPATPSAFQPMALQRPIRAGGACVVLAAAAPEPEAGVATPREAYRFAFEPASGC